MLVKYYCTYVRNLRKFIVDKKIFFQILKKNSSKCFRLSSKYNWIFWYLYKELVLMVLQVPLADWEGQPLDFYILSAGPRHSYQFLLKTKICISWFLVSTIIWRNWNNLEYVCHEKVNGLHCTHNCKRLWYYVAVLLFHIVERKLDQFVGEH